VRSGDPGAYDLTGSFWGAGGRKSPKLTRAIVRLDAVSVTRVGYAVDGWGEGELWFEGRTLVWHELPQPRDGGRAEAGRRRRRRPRSAGSGPEGAWEGDHHPRPGGETSRRPSRSTLPRISGRQGENSAPKDTRLVDELRRYFRGERIRFDSVTLATDGWTPFQRALVEALRAVRWGEVVSYSELARAAGYPNAQRAAGTFCAQNRFPIFVPCHRVVSAAGIGGYGSLGVGYKRRLLELEGVTL
jgi:methylated-DNA-[protein]-cysteine S-methyltransferase